jgi:cytochrome P460
MYRQSFPVSAIVGVALVALSTVSATPAGAKLAIPVGFEHWYLVNSMIVTKESPVFDAIGGLHLVYVNSVGLPRLKRGGSTPYPDGTMFTDDVRDFSLADGSYVQGGRKAIPVMLKDATKYASTGGWGFQAWAGGDPKKPLVTDPSQSCFACHKPQKNNDYTFSTYLR